MRSKGPPPQPRPQSQVPAGSGGVPGPGYPVEMLHLRAVVYQTQEIVHNIHQVFRFNQAVVHQMMEEMEETQEEIQEETMAILPRT